MTWLTMVQSRPESRALLSVGLSLSLVLALDAACDAQSRQAQDSPRQRPIEGFACSRDNLTTYTGVVIEYRRASGETTLRIRTDWDTMERVSLKHPGTDDPSAFFHMEGRPFNADSDWKKIEQSKGVLLAGTRAAAWVCSDGKTMVDWGAPKE